MAESWEAISDTTDAKRPFQGGDVAMKHFETIQKSEVRSTFNLTIKYGYIYSGRIGFHYFFLFIQMFCI